MSKVILVAIGGDASQIASLDTTPGKVICTCPGCPNRARVKVGLLEAPSQIVVIEFDSESEADQWLLNNRGRFDVVFCADSQLP